MLSKPNYIAIAAVFLVVLIFFRLPSSALSRAKMVFSGAFFPLFGLSAGTRELSGKTETLTTSKAELIRENNRLRAANDELAIQLNQYAEMVRENERLRTALGWERQSLWKVKMARVVGRDPENWWRSAQIDLGTRHGVRPNLPVVTPIGLVGRINEVSEGRSTVLLLGDPNLRVGAMIQETRERGVLISSTAGIFGNMIELNYLPAQPHLRPDHIVVTSGDGGYFPKGIPIGKIVDIRQVEFGLASEARVKLGANLNTLDEVWVLFP
jgi:rod shape-determining protein MreC